MIEAALLTGPLAALASGGAASVVGLLGILAMVAGWRRPGPPTPRALDRWRLANATALVLCMLAIAMGAPVLVVALSLVIWLSVHRAWTRAGADDTRVALLLGQLQLLLACVLSVSIWLLPLFLAWGALLPLALLRVEAGAHPIAAPRFVGPLALLLTIAFFVGLPRVTTEVGALASQTVTGFGDEVDLSHGGDLKDNPTVVARATFTRPDGTAPAGPFYLRGRALDHFDGARWTSTLGGAVRTNGLSDSVSLRAQITLEPGEDSALIGPAPLTGFSDLDAAITLDTNGNWSVDGPPRRLRYTALASDTAAPRPLRRAEAAALQAGVWLSLPPELDPRIPALAAALHAAAGDEPAARIAAFVDHLHDGFTYTTEAPPEAPADPLAAFLFDRKTGHCELFATALAVLLRADNIPARVVTGLYGGEWSALGGFWIFRQRDAHTWVEAWEGRWQPLDATPAGEAPDPLSLPAELAEVAIARWNRLILDYDLQAQLELGQALRDSLSWVKLPDGGPALDLIPDEAALVLVTALVFGGVLGGSRLLLRYLGAARGPPAARARPLRKALDQGLKLAQGRGYHLPPGAPPLEAAAALAALAGPAAEPLRTLAWLHYRATYGREPEAPLLAEAAAALRALAALPAAPVDEEADLGPYSAPQHTGD